MNFDHMVSNAMNAAKLYAEKTGTQVPMQKQRRTTPIKINHQGDVKLWHDYGYCVVGGPDAVCFYIDVDGRADIEGWTKSDANCPLIFIGKDAALTDTIAEFPEFPGWRVHATNGGKTLAVALVREGAEE